MSVLDDVADTIWGIGAAVVGLAIVKKGIDTITEDSSSSGSEESE